jgi:hypothetical protein
MTRQELFLKNTQFIIIITYEFDEFLGASVFATAKETIKRINRRLFAHPRHFLVDICP